jgi:hypothetical protein
MKFLALVRVGVFALTLASISALSISAQSGTGGGSPGGQTTGGGSGVTTTSNRDNDTDYGWIGLLGLVGLAGLLRKRDASAHDRIPDTGRATAR